MDIAVFQREAFFGEGLVEGGFLDAVFEEVGAGDGCQEVERGGFDDAGAPGVGDDFAVRLRPDVVIPYVT